MLTTINDHFFHVPLRNRIDSEICAQRMRPFRDQSADPIDPNTAMILNDNVILTLDCILAFLLTVIELHIYIFFYKSLFYHLLLSVQLIFRGTNIFF